MSVVKTVSSLHASSFQLDVASDALVTWLFSAFLPASRRAGKTFTFPPDPRLFSYNSKRQIFAT